MIKDIERLKGIHPGAIVERELKKRNLKKGPFALAVKEYPQTISAITKQKRDMNIPLSLKIEDALGLEEGILMTLQVYFDIKKEREKINNKNVPDLSLLRSSLFWDTDINKIDWERQKKSVIKRVFERGNEEERNEIVKFYGREVICTVIGNSEIDQQLPLSSRFKQQYG